MSTQIRHSLLERKKEELIKIQRLLNSILNNEEFGICEDCGGRIPEARLLIVPEATRCVRCQGKMEKRNSRKRLLERSRASNGHITRLEQEDEGESNAHTIPFKTERESLSFMDIEEGVLEDDQNSNDS
jgi:phage/conjugal plasmid C-4 type zinc finger TraR family protein